MPKNPRHLIVVCDMQRVPITHGPFSNCLRFLMKYPADTCMHFAIYDLTVWRAAI